MTQPRTEATIDPLAIAPTVLTDVRHFPALQSVLVVDLDEPFFFDHPLDHVPGIMLVAALLELGRLATDGIDSLNGEETTHTGGAGGPVRRRRMLTSLRFVQFCELDEPTELQACPVSTGSCTILAAQSRGPVCLGSIGWDEPVRPAGEPAPAYPDELSTQPVDGSLVHRVNSENILISQVSQVGSGPLRTAMLNPPQEHYFARRRRHTRDPAEFIEAARQATTMLWSRVYGWPVDARLTLNAVSAELPITVARHDPVELRWSPVPVSTGTTVKARSVFEVVVGGDHPERAGQVSFESQAWTETQWQRLRQRRLAGP